jgi:hypothetical protein
MLSHKLPEDNREIFDNLRFDGDFSVTKGMTSGAVTDSARE